MEDKAREHSQRLESEAYHDQAGVIILARVHPTIGSAAGVTEARSLTASMHQWCSVHVSEMRCSVVEVKDSQSKRNLDCLIRRGKVKRDPFRYPKRNALIDVRRRLRNMMCTRCGTIIHRRTVVNSGNLQAIPTC